MLRVVVCVSGGGTNLQALIDAIEEGKIKDAQIVRVISNNAGAYALERAKRHGIDRKAFNGAFMKAVEEARPDLIILAGFLVVISEEMIQKYRNRILNVHPSLIPAFCGTGYYGLEVHKKVLERGVKITGATVHFVDEGTDTGPVVLQKAVEVHEDDTLQRRVMEEAEWLLLPKAVDLFSRGKIRIENGRAIVSDD